MPKPDSELDRLLRAAAESADAPPAEAPFGFDTRVVARWRALCGESGPDFWEFARMFRRVAIGAMIVTMCASAAAYWQFEQNNELEEPATNAYAIADTVIEAGTWQ